MKKQRNRRIGWWITECGEQAIRQLKAERRGRDFIRKHVRAVPVYTIPERKDGRPSINTPEGWEALRQRLMKESGVSNEPCISFVSKDIDKAP